MSLLPDSLHAAPGHAREVLEDGECAVLMRPELHSWLKVADMAQGSDLIPAGDQHRQPHEVKILQAIRVKGPGAKHAAKAAP